MLKTLRCRTDVLSSELVNVHKKMLNAQIPQELVDHVAATRGGNRYFKFDKENDTPIEHEVSLTWTNPYKEAYLLQLHSGDFTLGVAYMDDGWIEYVYPSLSNFSCNSLKQTLGGIRALDKVHHDVVYISEIESLSNKIGKIVTQVRQEARCADLNVSMVELGRIDDDIALTEYLERFGRQYERYILRSNLGRMNRPRYDGIAKEHNDDCINLSLRMGWLNIVMTINKDSTFKYNMPILNLTYTSIGDLMSDRFNHLLSVSSWDIVRSANMEFNNYERLIVELATKILNYKELPEESEDE